MIPCGTGTEQVPRQRNVAIVPAGGERYSITASAGVQVRSSIPTPIEAVPTPALQAPGRLAFSSRPWSMQTCCGVAPDQRRVLKQSLLFLPAPGATTLQSASWLAPALMPPALTSVL
jgi:hypothetical protein